MAKEEKEKKVEKPKEGAEAAAEGKKVKGYSSAQKRNRQSLNNRARNKAYKSEVKTAIRSFNESVAKKDVSAKEALNKIFSLVDKGAKKNILKKNKSNRIKSKLSLLLQNKK